MSVGFELIRAAEVDDDLAARWTRLQSEAPTTASPFFCPEFTTNVASVRSDVLITVLHERGEIVGLFPFQRAGRMGRPVGGGRSNYHGVIGAPELDFDPRALLQACGIDMWAFDHLIASQTPFARFHRALVPSPYMDLAEGFEAYLHSRREAGSQIATATFRKARRMEREVGPVRFVPADHDPLALQQLMSWKSAQYRRTQAPDRFSEAWNVNLLKRIGATSVPSFAGMCSTLRAGDELVAVHFGMRSRHVWHWWFPAYAPEFGKYSPGTILLLRMAAAAPALGIDRVDLGPGPETYKDRLKSGDMPLASGAAYLPSVLAARRAARERAKHIARRLGLEARLRRAATRLRRRPHIG